MIIILLQEVIFDHPYGSVYYTNCIPVSSVSLLWGLYMLQFCLPRYFPFAFKLQDSHVQKNLVPLASYTGSTNIQAQGSKPGTLTNYMDVSENSGTPKSSILIGVSIIFTIHFGGKPPIFGSTPISFLSDCRSLLP